MGYARSAIMLTLAAVVGFTNPPNDRVEVQDGSRLWIEGASNVNEWTCEAGTMDGSAAIVQENGASQPSATLSVPVESFDCGRERMNRDFIEALKASDYPEIVYELTEAEVIEPSSAPDGWHLLRVRGKLTLAGSTRVVETEAWGRQTDEGTFRIRGNKALTMTEFGVKPPVALLGLVKAYDRIDVHFDLTAAPEGIASR